MEGRNQLVKIDNSISDKCESNFGVIQGSVLGPVLFNIYLNDFCSQLPNCKTICFADDTVLLFSNNTWNDTKLDAENGLRLAKRWFDHNLLTIHEDKTIFTCFAPTKAGFPKEQLQIKIHNCDNYNPCHCEILKNTEFTY